MGNCLLGSLVDLLIPVLLTVIRVLFSSPRMGISHTWRIFWRTFSGKSRDQLLLSMRMWYMGHKVLFCILNIEFSISLGDAGEVSPQCDISLAVWRRLISGKRPLSCLRRKSPDSSNRWWSLRETIGKSGVKRGFNGIRKTMASIQTLPNHASLMMTDWLDSF